MDGHPMMQAKLTQTTKAPIRQPTGLFERNPIFDGMDDDNTEKAIKTERKPSPAASTQHQQQQDFSMDMDMSYGSANSNFEEPTNNLPFATNVDYQYDLPAVNAPTSNYLIGPMIVRVKPDGTPVDEDKTKPLPIDDDREAMTIGSTGFFPSSRTPSTRLEAPAAPSQVDAIVQPVQITSNPNSEMPRAHFMPNTFQRSNYRTMTRNQH